MEKTAAPAGKTGCGPLAIIIIILVIIAAIFGIDQGLGAYGLHCGDMPIKDCLALKPEEDQLSQDQRNSLVAASGPYEYEGYSVILTLKIPLSGGPVTGTISGACNGRATGRYGGQNNGGISGRITGTCNVFFVKVPASATYNGSVNKDKKVVPISFKGSGGGFSHSGSLALSY